MKWVFLLLLFLNLSACQDHANETVEGYIEGKYTYISAEVPGNLKALFVKKGEKVTLHQRLFALDPMPELAFYQSALSEYEVAISQRKVIARDVDYLKITLARHQALYNKKVEQKSVLDLSQKNYDNILFQLKEADAKIAALNAKVNSSKWQVMQKNVLSPLSGYVFDVYYRLGETVSVTQPVLSLISAKDIKLIFYVGEEDLHLFQRGTFVTVAVDRNQHRYRAVIDFISPQAEYVPPVLFSKETNAKLVYRIEANFAEKEALSLHPGQPVRVAYKT